MDVRFRAERGENLISRDARDQGDSERCLKEAWVMILGENRLGVRQVTDKGRSPSGRLGF